MNKNSSDRSRGRVDYWQGKVVLVTGGSAGLGEAICRRLVQERASVVAVARNADRLQEAIERWQATPEQACAFAADVTQDADVERLAAWVTERYGGLDAVVHAAGLSDRGRLVETPLEKFRQLWELNALAAVRVAQHFWPLLCRSHGHLVLIGSLASKCAARYLGAYPASKFALAAIAQQLRLEGEDSGVHTLLVCPGPIARPDAGRRYDQAVRDLPPEARKPGGGVRLKGIDPDRLARQILESCRKRQAELVVPARARWLFALLQLSPAWGDWLAKRFTSG
ncbi:MAG: oxidoreductase [Pirellulaceae bacterium]|nr:MAG: oxidoreductase [Pirellulaceae bacterium]